MNSYSENTKPLISVCMTTYFHEKYIARAIESVLMQNVSVPYEIIISDDHSLDNTVSILRDYEKKYPFVHVNVNSDNLGIARNVYLTRTMARGKYITILSGDDYWSDPDKLQKQFNFMEQHPHYAGVTSRLMAVDENGKELFVTPDKKRNNTDFTLEMYFKGKDFSMNGMMMKNFYIDPATRKKFSIMPEVSRNIDDLTDEMLILMQGSVFQMDDVMQVYVYRDNVKGAHNYNSLFNGMKSFQNHIELLNNLSKKFPGQNFKSRYLNVSLSGYGNAIKYKKLKEYDRIFSTIPEKYRKGLKKEVLLNIPAKIFFSLKKNHSR